MLRRRTERTKQLSEVCNARVASTRALQEKFVSHVIYLAGVLPGAPRTLDRLVYGGARTTGWWSPWWPLASGSAVRRKAGHTSEPEHWFTITADYAQWIPTAHTEDRLIFRMVFDRTDMTEYYLAGRNHPLRGSLCAFSIDFKIRGSRSAVKNCTPASQNISHTVTTALIISSPFCLTLDTKLSRSVAECSL